MLIFCPECGKELSVSDPSRPKVFCRYCGAEVDLAEIQSYPERVDRPSPKPSSTVSASDHRSKRPSRILIAGLVLIVLFLAFAVLKNSSLVKSFKGGFITSNANFSAAYAYTEPNGDTHYLLFGSNVNAVWFTSSKSSRAYLTTIQSSDLVKGIDAVFYYPDRSCHRHFELQNSSTLAVTETKGGSSPNVFLFKKTDLNAAKNALDEMTAIYDVSKP